MCGSSYFRSSVSAYGPETPGPVKEDFPLGAHTLPYAIHKRESDEVVRYRAESLGDCCTYVLRPHIFAGCQHAKLHDWNAARNGAWQQSQSGAHASSQ